MPQMGTTTTTAPPPPPPPPPPTSEPRVPRHDDSLRRGGEHRMLAGVAAGLAEYFDVDPTLVRVGFVALSLLGGIAVPLYLAGWLLIPDKGAEFSVAEELLARERSR